MTSRPEPLARSLYYIAGIYSLALFLAGMLFSNFTVDDAFITFRYGQTLHQQGFWTWNPSGLFHPVEAYTNPLFAFLSIPVHFMQVPVMAPYKILGFVTLIATYLVATSGLSNQSKIISIALTSTNFYIFPHAFSGLETLLFLLVILYILEADADQLSSDLFSLLIFIAPLIRPEGALASIYILIHQIRSKKINNLTYLSIALGLTYFTWRYTHFGKLLPNTFYVKMHGGSFYENLKSEQFIILLGLASLISLRLVRIPLLLPLLLISGYVGINLTSDMQMNYCHRFGYHLVVPIALHAAKQTLFAIDRSAIRSPHSRPATMWIMLALLFFLSAKTISLRSAIQILDYYPSALASHKQLGQALSKAKKTDTVIAVGDAGLIPYHSGLPTIDFIGLANSEIGDFFSKNIEPNIPKPDIVIVYGKSPASCDLDRSLYPGLDLIARQHLQHTRYTCHTGPNWAGEYYLNALISTDSKNYTDLVQIFAEYKNNPPNARSQKQIIHDAVRFIGLRADLAG